MSGSLGLGMAAALGVEVATAVAPEAERLGYRTFWTNDLPGSPGLPLVAAVQRATRTVVPAVGVIPCDGRTSGEIVAMLRDGGVDVRRAVVGLGAGRARQPIDAVRGAVRELRDALGDDLLVAIGALGPRMCRLAGEIADVVLLSWMTPERIRWARDRIAEGEARGRRRPARPVVSCYVRVAIGIDAHERLAAEATRYSRIGSYAKSFEAMGVDPRTVGIASADGSDVAAVLRAYREVLDEAVVRALPATADTDGVLEVARAAAPNPRSSR